MAITHGDTNGIGYEVIFKTFEDPTMLELCTPIIYGSPKVAAYHRKTLNLDVPFNIISNAAEARDGHLNMLTTFDEDVKVELGSPTEESRAAAQKAMALAREDLQKGLYDVLVVAPVVPGRTPVRDDKSLMVMVCDAIRIGLVTNRLPIKEVAEAITTEKIATKGSILNLCLKRDFRISSPRIAVLALNPQEGAEEQYVIAPAIEAMEKEGIQAFGPYQADDFFGNALYDSFDGVLAMYDDQGNVPFKTLAHEYGIKLKAGISPVCVAPGHGPAFDIAGKGIADEASMRHAVYSAIDIFRHRRDYDEPLANPLPKLYHEKREDGEKARFAVKIKEPFKKGSTAADDAAFAKSQRRENEEK